MSYEKRHQRALSSSLSSPHPCVYVHRGQAMWEVSKKAAFSKLRRETSPETKSAEILILNFQPPQLWEVNFCFLSHPICDIWCRQPEQPKTSIHSATECYMSVWALNVVIDESNTHWSSEADNSQAMQTQVSADHHAGSAKAGESWGPRPELWGLWKLLKIFQLKAWYRYVWSASHLRGHHCYSVCSLKYLLF